MTKTVLLRIDPYDKNTGLAIPQIVQKFADVLSQLGDDEGVVAVSFFPRLWARDPAVLLLAAIDPETGIVKGFTAAAMSNDGQCLMLQPKMDESTESDVVGEMIEAVEAWAKTLNFTVLTMIGRRADSKWMKRYGFEISRYVMVKPIE